MDHSEDENKDKYALTIDSSIYCYLKSYYVADDQSENVINPYVDITYKNAKLMIEVARYSRLINVNIKSRQIIGISYSMYGIKVPKVSTLNAENLKEEFLNISAIPIDTFANIVLLGDEEKLLEESSKIISILGDYVDSIKGGLLFDGLSFNGESFSALFNNTHNTPRFGFRFGRFDRVIETFCFNSANNYGFRKIFFFCIDIYDFSIIYDLIKSMGNTNLKDTLEEIVIDPLNLRMIEKLLFLKLVGFKKGTLYLHNSNMVERMVSLTISRVTIKDQFEIGLFVLYAWNIFLISLWAKNTVEWGSQRLEFDGDSHLEMLAQLIYTDLSKTKLLNCFKLSKSYSSAIFEIAQKDIYLIDPSLKIKQNSTVEYLYIWTDPTHCLYNLDEIEQELVHFSSVSPDSLVVIKLAGDVMNRYLGSRKVICKLLKLKDTICGGLSLNYFVIDTEIFSEFLTKMNNISHIGLSFGDGSGIEEPISFDPAITYSLKNLVLDNSILPNIDVLKKSIDSMKYTNLVNTLEVIWIDFTNFDQLLDLIELKILKFSKCFLYLKFYYNNLLKLSLNYRGCTIEEQREIIEYLSKSISSHTDAFGDDHEVESNENN